MEAMLARSKSGHDRGHVYVILREEGEYVYLVDGVRKTAEKPKKKNRKHIQIIKKMPEPVEALLCREDFQKNEVLKRALKLYEKSVEKERHFQGD